MSALGVYLLSLGAKATVLLLVSGAVAFVLRRRSASLRHGVWSLAMVALLLLPALGWLLPVVPVPVSTLSPPAATVPTPLAGPSAPPVSRTMSTGAEGVNATRSGTRFWLPTTERADAATTGSRISVAEGAFAIYLLGVLFLLGRLALAHAAAARLLGRATPVSDDAWMEQLAQATTKLGIERPVRLLRSAEVPVPFAVGVRNPAVVLPQAAERWCPARRAAVLSHELAHIQRGDCLTQALAALACALYWPHPLAWWAAARLRLERELACDDRALGLGQAPADYAGHLLELARSFQTPPALAPVAMGMAAPSQLEQRLRSVLDAARERHAPGRPMRFAAALAFACLLLPLAAMRAVPPAAASAATAVPAHPGVRPAQPVSVQRAAEAAAAPTAAEEIADAVDGIDEAAIADAAAADASAAWDEAPMTEPELHEAPMDEPQDVEDETPASEDQESDTPTAGEWTITDRHGDTATLELFWDDGTNWRRELKLEELDGDDERHFRIDGEAGVFEFKGKLAKGQGSFEFVPNRDFPAKLRAIGVRDAHYGGDHQLKNLAWGGASVESVQEFRSLGFSNLSMADLTNLAVFNIRPEFVRQMRKQGKPNTDTIAGITGLRIHE